MLQRLEHALPLLTSGQRDAPSRQRTLRATIAWSYDLLTDDLRDLLARLSVFAGTFTLDAVEAVVGGSFEQLDALVEASLLKPVGSDRFLMLETIREFASERLEELAVANELDRRHAYHYVEVAGSTNLGEHGEGVPRQELAGAELSNFRKALGSAVREQIPEVGLRLMLALEQFWVARAPFEARGWFERLFAVSGDVDPELHARALLQYGGLVFIVGEFERGERIYDQSMAEYRALGDPLGVAHVQSRLVIPAVMRNEFVRARELAQECLEVYRRLQHKRGEAIAVGLLGDVEWRAGNRQLGIRLTRESLALATAAGFDWWRVGMLYALAEWAIADGDFAEAEPRAREALEQAHRIGDRQHRIYLFALLARCMARSGRVHEAGMFWAAVELEERGGPIGQWEDERDDYASPVLEHADEHFEAARRLGLQKTLDELVGVAVPR